MVNIPGRVNAFEPGVDAHRDLRHGDGTTAIAVHTEAADARVPYSTDACYWHVAQPLMRSERIRRRWRAAADVPGARIAIRARGFTEWTRSFFLPPASAEGTTFYLAAVRHPRGGFSFLTRESEGELAFHHRCPIVLDWDAARRWASSEGDDVSALDAHLTARLVNGDRLQPPITSMLSVRALAPPSLDSDSEGSATEDEEEEEERDRDVPSDEPIPLARPRPDETPMSLVDWTARQTELLGALGRLAIAPEHASPKRRASARLAARLQRKLAREAAERALRVELIAHLGEHGVDQPRSQWELEDVRRMLEVLSRLQRWLLAGTVAAVIDQLRPSPEHADLLANFVATSASVIAARGRQTTRLERQRRVLAAERPEPPLGMLPTDEARRRDVVFFNGGPWCEHPFATILLVACAMPSLVDMLDGFRSTTSGPPPNSAHRPAQASSFGMSRFRFVLVWADSASGARAPARKPTQRRDIAQIYPPATNSQEVQKTRRPTRHCFPVSACTAAHPEDALVCTLPRGRHHHATLSLPSRLRRPPPPSPPYRPPYHRRQQPTPPTPAVVVVACGGAVLWIRWRAISMTIAPPAMGTASALQLIIGSNLQHGRSIPIALV